MSIQFKFHLIIESRIQIFREIPKISNENLKEKKNGHSNVRKTGKYDKISNNLFIEMIRFH